MRQRQGNGANKRKTVYSHLSGEKPLQGRVREKKREQHRFSTHLEEDGKTTLETKLV